MSNKTASCGQLVNGLRVGVSVSWNGYPVHTTRQIKLTVGGLTIRSEVFSIATRDAVLVDLRRLLADDEALAAELSAMIMEVPL